MKRTPMVATSLLTFTLAVVIVSSCQVGQSRPSPRDELASRAHADLVMTSAFCARCHPTIYAEHEQNTHGMAFTDEEVRLATGRFDHGDCIRCHTPRPVFETGIGMNPIRRHHNLEEGNTCMTCHWKPEYDYGSFQGGGECVDAFDPRVGTVEACASCHRNHGTPYQWAKAPKGKARGRRCVTCHMEQVTRPVAIGEAPRPVRSHVFPGCRSESQLRKAYKYEAALDGNEAVVRISSADIGHNFPTELKQRALESLIVVRDADGNEVDRSRMVFRDPYKRPYGLNLPVNTQIPGGESREHRVPIKVANGTVDCELHFKLYYPIADHHPDLARRLENRRLAFNAITPSTAEVVSAPEVRVTTPEQISPEAAGVAHLIDYARHKIGDVKITLPEGDGPEAIAELILMFQFPVPEGNRLAQARLAEIGVAAIPALVEGLGSWDNKTWKQSMKVLRRIGEPALPAILDALRSDQLYVRLHARQLAPKLAWGERRGALIEAVASGLAAPHPLDRASAAETLSWVATSASATITAALRPLLDDRDPDVVRAAALALAQLDDRGAAPAIIAAMRRATFVETRRDLAEAAALLGCPDGIGELLDGLDHRDELLREKSFESLFAVTGWHAGYDPLQARPDRLAGIARLRNQWAVHGGPDALRRPPRPDPRTNTHAWGLVSQLAGGAGIVPGGDDEAIVQELIAMDDAAVPALVLGLKFAPGFDRKRARICECLGRIGSREAAPALAGTLHDPVLAVAAWACWALEQIDDPAVLPALTRFQDRLLTLVAAGRIPPSIEPVDRLLMQAARSRLLLGDDNATADLVAILLSDDDYARRQAIDALDRRFGDRRGYDPDASAAERREAAARWNQ